MAYLVETGVLLTPDDEDYLSCNMVYDRAWGYYCHDQYYVNGLEFAIAEIQMMFRRGSCKNAEYAIISTTDIYIGDPHDCEETVVEGEDYNPEKVVYSIAKFGKKILENFVRKEVVKMGEFSFLRADRSTKQANFVPEQPCKLLVPKEFGGGSISGIYAGYGQLRLKDGSEVDLLGVLAYMNKASGLEYEGDFPSTMEEIIVRGNPGSLKNREIGCHLKNTYEGKIATSLPLKLASPRYKGTYEDADMVSRSDPFQGLRKVGWDEVESYIEWAEPKSDPQKAILDLIQNYLNDCSENGHSDFEVWCEGNLTNSREVALFRLIKDDVNSLSDALFCNSFCAGVKKNGGNK